MSAIESSRSAFKESRVERLSLRADLTIRQMTATDNWRWVVKDPLANTFHYFSDLEMRVMKQLDGRPLAAVMQSCTRMFPNEYLSADSLVVFLADLQKRGLLKTARQEKKEFRLDEVLSPLAIRLPGFNPERLLDRIYRVLRFAFQPFVLVIACGIVFLALIRTLFFAEQLYLELPSLSTMFTTENAWTVVIVIGLVKVIHEFAHGLTCRHFGGRCTEMGLMFLVFIPCLYCDVSDIWLERRRWARIAVSAAGMCAEIFLAACAALIWSLTTAGFLHSLCLTIMIVCSAKTLLFNGNPLMRYDGYFILSDILAVPNLATESRQHLIATLKSAFWGTPADASTRQDAPGWLLFSYGLLSLAYQFLVLGLILFGIHQFFAEASLRSVGTFIVLLMSGMVMVRWWKARGQWRLSPVERRYIQPRQVVLKGLGISILVSAILFVPLPRSVSVPYLIEAGTSHVVHTNVNGRLVDAIAEGSEVRVGDWLATLSNPQLEREVNLLRAEKSTMQSRLDQALSRRGEAPGVASEIPALRAAIESASKRLALRELELARLVIRAPATGRVIAPRFVANSFGEREGEVSGWQGTPLDPQNLGCQLLAGSELCSIASTTDWQAAMLVPQTDIELIRLGQPVRVFTRSYQQGYLSGVVDSIDASPLAQLPIELVVAGTIAVDPNSLHITKSLEPMYRVIVRFHPEDPRASLTIRSVGLARVQLARCSLFERASRFLWGISAT